MTLLRDLINIPTSVGDSDFVVRAAAGADLANYVVTDQLRDSFTKALAKVEHAVTTGRSQATFLHGSFGSGKSHFMAVLREILHGNPEARALRNLGEQVVAADRWLTGRRLLTLTFHMLDARSVEQAVLEGYLNQITALHPDAPTPAVHRSDALLTDAARLRARMGDEAFFAALSDADPGVAAGSASSGADSAAGSASAVSSDDETPGLAVLHSQRQGWTADRYAAAAAEPPGTADRDRLVTALTTAFFTNAVRSGEYLDLDTGLAVITRHASDLGYDGIVLFLDEMILWLSTKMSDHVFVNTEGAKLNKLVESADADRPIPLISFVARQRNLEDFLGPQVGGTEREALALVLRSVQGRLGEIPLADTNLPEITEKRLLKPLTDEAKAEIDRAFAVVRGNRQVWDILLLGAQYGDAGIGSDATAFRKLYPFSPALVATLVALSQALQRERTAIKVMTELLVERRDTLRINDLIGVAALFEPLVLRGELPDRVELRQRFEAARDLYGKKLRPLLLWLNSITEADAAANTQFELDDKLIKTVLLGALVPEVPALHNLTAGKLHALNFGTITSPIPGYEHQIVLNRLNKVANEAGELHLTDGADPVVTIELHTVDYDKLLDWVRPEEATTGGALQQLLRELVSTEIGLTGATGQLGELQHPREWRGRRHTVQVKFGNVRDGDSMPVAALLPTGEAWRIVIDYPFDPQGRPRSDDRARIEALPRGERSVFWLPLYFSDQMMGHLAQLSKINYLLGGTGERYNDAVRDWSVSERQQGRVYLQQRQTQLRGTVTNALKQAYGVAAPQPGDVVEDSVGVLHTLDDAVDGELGDPRGGTLAQAFHNLTGQLLAATYPGRPALPEDEKPPTSAELAKVLTYARQAVADPTRGVTVPATDQRTLRRICNNLQLGELADHRYVLTTSTSYWTRHLLQRAAADGYRDSFPVHRLRGHLDQPEPRGFDRSLQNLILCVFALDHQLAWYLNEGQVTVDRVDAVTDAHELKFPPMPSDTDWHRAIERAQHLFGQVLPAWLIPANLAKAAAQVRKVAAERGPAVSDLLDQLTAHAGTLGLDPAADTGRIGVTRRLARLLTDLRHERDDVVLIAQLAGADLGDIDDATAGTAIASAPTMVRALRDTQWAVLTAITSMAADDERARALVDRLHTAAGHHQHSLDLVGELHAVFGAAAALLAERRPTSTPSPPPDPDPAPDPRPNPQLPGGGATVTVADPSGTRAMGYDHTGGGSPAVPGAKPPRQRTIVDEAGLKELTDEISGELAQGRRVRITWETE
ncbi:phage resistance protein [Micromonospora sp. LOL_028]|uniref:phage resistance protein n=1 Tax=Micromonospora sp. LOL_028 TaxID=3345420 RepID=UPI003A86FE07